MNNEKEAHGLIQWQGFILAHFQYPEYQFCIEALYEVLSRFGRPEIFNTDQGAQFVAMSFTDVLKSHRVQISMDGHEWIQDNIFIKRLWWSLKCQYLYLWSFDNGAELRKGLNWWFNFYNSERPHQSLYNKI
jgi:putative transposase